MARSCRILVVDDDPLFLATACDLLASLPNVEVVGRGTSGQEALDLTAQLAPDLVLMGLQMPGLNGFEVARRLAASPRCVVIVSLIDLPEYRDAAIAAGTAAFVVKTDFFGTLPELIRDLLPDWGREDELPTPGASADARRVCNGHALQPP
jgi:DNA-binding NarL/FixJ family response regulator